MIISHKHKFIFIKTEKTAGTSIELALSKICGSEDIITPISPADEIKRKELNVRGPQNYFIPYKKYKKLDWAKLLIQGKRAVMYNHMSAEDIKNVVGKKIWNKYYKFSFERNPWDKAVSWFYWKMKKVNKKITIDEFIDLGIAGKVKGFDLYTIGGVLAVDDIFKYEDLNKSMNIISKKIHLDQELKLPNYIAKGRNVNDKRPYNKILSENAKNKIALYSAREINLMNYKF
jgi:hypothetical protein